VSRHSKLTVILTPCYIPWLGCGLLPSKTLVSLESTIGSGNSGNGPECTPSSPASRLSNF
jgi:hypothetical protein